MSVLDFFGHFANRKIFYQIFQYSRDPMKFQSQEFLSRVRAMHQRRQFVVRFLAFFRINQAAVCYLSSKLGAYDYHDYPDSYQGEPWHFVKLECKHCGKGFYI